MGEKRTTYKRGLTSSKNGEGIDGKPEYGVDHRIKQTEYDPETGKVRQKTLPVRLVVREEKQRTDENWVVLWQGVGPMSVYELAADKNLTGSDYRVLLMVLALLDMENNVIINQSEVAEMLGTSQPNVGRSLKKLLDMEVITKGPAAGRQCSYRLNPATAWKGALRQGATEKRKEARKRDHLKIVK